MVQGVLETTGAEQVFWDLTSLYQSVDDPAIGRDLAEVQRRADAFAERYRGRVASLSADELAGLLSEAEEMYELVGRLGTFASLSWTTDTANPANGALLQRIQEEGSRLQQKVLFFDLEWANIPDEHIKITAEPVLARWHHYLENLLRVRPYLLSEPEEKILAEKAVTGVQSWTRFFGEVLSNYRFELDGQQVPENTVLRQLYLTDREARKRAADSLTAGLKDMLHTTTYTFNIVLSDKASNDQLRKYPTWISSRNLENEVSDETVNALITAVTARYDIVARYYRNKRKLLGLDELYDYDRYAPLSQVDSRYTWNEARDVVLTAYRAFDPQMANIASEFFDKNWIHAPAMNGKRGGAFASPSVPGHHPYVLVNFTGNARDVTTLAHELGHGVHMFLSRPKGYFEAYTPLTTAEMASVFGEMLVFTDMMGRETDKQARIAMLASKIEDTFATVFRQISMNRFEDSIHAARRAEGELSSARLSELWMASQKAMFGDSVTMRDDYSTWWSYVPHFLNTPGYVYAYAFGELLVLALFNQYRKEGASFVPKYLEVLSAGESDKPENIMAKVGIDLTDPNFWQQGVTFIETMVEDLEKLIAE